MAVTLLALLLAAPRPSANGKHRQHCHRRQLESLIADGDPCQHRQHREQTQRRPQPLHLNHPNAGNSGARPGAPEKTWCTGEDSNLRSSQGAADLQSAAINHSATCARSTEHPVLIAFLRARRRRWPGIASLCCQRTPRAKPCSAIPAKLRISRAALLPRAFCDLGSCCWNQFSRRAARLVWLAPATPCGALTVTILELAKGFEPPTL